YVGPLKLKNIPQTTKAYRLSSHSTGSMLRPSMRRANAPLSAPTRPSVAVLAFKDMSAGQDQAYFCSGLSQEIAANLARFRELFVISHHSSALFRGVDGATEEIGRELGVEYVLQGTVSRSNSRLRVVTQLIETAHGSYVWADKFDRNVED